MKHLSAYFIYYFKKFHILLKMNYDLVSKMHVNNVKNYLKVRGLKISDNKN